MAGHPLNTREQKIQFCTARDGAKIAYAITGNGPPLVRAAHYLSHLEYDFDSPVWRHWIRELSRYNIYIRYDERGCGLSDQDPPEFSFDAWVSDLETVVDSIGLERFDLLGVSQGGAVAIAYASRHPERVKHLVLYGAYARGWGRRTGPGVPASVLETRKTMHRLIELGWGQDNPAFRQLFTSLFVPEGGLEEQRWFNELQRISCSPQNAVRFDEVFSSIDVTDLLPKLSVPTLILHARHDGVAPFEEGRLLASKIPGASFTSFEGKNHILLEQEMGWLTFLGEVRKFIGLPVGETRSRQAEGERKLAAIMFTDTVGSTALAQKNEALAVELLEEQRGLVRPLFSQHKGREIKTIGDGFLVEFSSALDAVRCATAIQSALNEANGRKTAESRTLVRIGIHLGDVIHTGTDLAGDAVNIASRIEPLAPPGGICLTAQVYASVLNKVDLEFESLGTPQLKGVSTPIEVFRVAGYGEAASRPVTASPAPSTERIAVLPFRNISPDPNDDYFADGMTEELISAISKIGGLRVIARASVMRYKGKDKAAEEIARELKVSSLLEGSVRKQGNRARISVHMVDAANDEERWSEEYERELQDIFAVQGDISRKVAEVLRVQALQKELKAVGREATQKPEAYVLYLRGRQHWNRRTRVDLEEAVKLFEKALSIDPTYAKAYSGVADAYSMLASYATEYVPPSVAYPKARTSVQKALELDPDLVEAHTSLGVIKFHYEWDWNGAEEEFTKAIQLGPSYAPAHQFYSDHLKAMGRLDEALSEIRRAQELDPLSLPINSAVGHVLYLARRYDAAIDQYRRVLELDPSFMQTHIWFGRPLLEKGMFEEALAELQAGVRLSGESSVALGMLGHGLASAGRKDEALEILEKLKERSRTQYVSSYWMAAVCNGLKDREQTLAWLRKAFDERSSWLVWCNVEPRFDWLREDPGFASLMNLMKFP